MQKTKMLQSLQKKESKSRDEVCEAYEKRNNLIPFNGAGDVLSNFYPCDLDICGVSHKSTDLACQYIKSLRCGDLQSANKIKDAPDALSAKRLDDKVKPNDQWAKTEREVMAEIVENKCVQVSEFKRKLRTAKQNTVFVESTFSDKWGSGLDRDGTLNTKIDKWSGENFLDVIIGTIAKKSENVKRVTR